VSAGKREIVFTSNAQYSSRAPAAPLIVGSALKVTSAFG
jgi:hypothetical protein